MSLRPRSASSADVPHAVQIHNQQLAVYARAAAVATGVRFHGGAATGMATVPDLSEHNALADRVSKLEQAQKDMGERINRVDARLDTTLAEMKKLLNREIAKVARSIDTLETRVTGNETKYDRVWTRLMKLEARISAEAIEPKGFQENDSPFPRSTMGAPRGAY